MSSLIVSAGSAGDASTGGAPSSPVASGGPLSAVSGRFLSPFACGGPSSAVLGCFSSPVASGGPLSAILCHLSFFIAGGYPSSAVSGHPLFPVTGGGPLSAVRGCPLSPMPPAGSRALFLTSIPSCARRSFLPFLPLFHSSLPSLPTPLTYNPAPLTGKKSFDQVFITQRVIASIRQQKKLDLSFTQCSYSATIKMKLL